MTTHQVTMTIDLGEVGYRRERANRFCIELDAGPLLELTRDAANAHRVYELLLIDRPGDIWDYVWVVPRGLPPGVAHRVAHARKAGTTAALVDASTWPDDRIPFNVFDSLFVAAGDDAKPEHEAWLAWRGGQAMQTFAQLALATARSAQSQVMRNDPLLKHIAARTRKAEHPYCFLDRNVARAKGRQFLPSAPVSSAAFYDKLSELLRDPKLASVTYRGGRDYRVLRLMATEQRRRATRTGHAAGNALYLSAVANTWISNEAWESDIRLFVEGLAHGDLMIDESAHAGNVLGMLDNLGEHQPGAYYLSARDAGDVRGYARELGDGWVVYKRKEPDTRRVALARIEGRRYPRLGGMLSFSDNGATLFGHEKALIVVGAQVAGDAREALALIVAHWQRMGASPLLVVLGNTEAFDRAGCSGYLCVPANCEDDATSARWLTGHLHLDRPWLDAVVALEAPGWAGQLLAEWLELAQDPWPAWIVATEGEAHLKVDHVLTGDLGALLAQAHRRAQSRWPSLQ